MIKSFEIIYIFYFSILYSNIILVPEDYSTIQLAINNANNTDTVLVNSGIYVENITIDNLSISLLSSYGPSNTIIDGNYNGSVINVNSQEDSVLIKGFTIKNGIGELLDAGSRFGGGIISHNTVLILDSLIIENNESFAGGGICFYAMDFTPTHSILKNSIIQNNIASEGGGVFCINQSLNILQSTINNNGMTPYGSGGGIQALVSDINIIGSDINNNHSRFGGGIYIGNSDAEIETSIISNNLSDSKGGGIWVGSDSQLSIFETLISDNMADGFGGSIFISLSWIAINKSTIVSNIISPTVLGAGIYADGGGTLIQNSIVYFNRREEDESINHNINGYSSNYLIEYDVEYSDIEGSENWIPNGFGVISINPEFEEDSYFLSDVSPCIDAGSPNYTDPDGTIFDMGAYYYHQNSCGITGDLNENNTVDVIDIIILVNTILNIESIYNLCYDINDDNFVDILDVVSIIQIIF